MIMDVKKETSSELKNISKTNILQYLSCSSPSAAPLPHCSPSADMVIHCRDGRLAGHRLVLASISGMLHEELLCNSADDLTSVMMPDFTLDQVSSYLHHVYACQDVEKFQEINTSIGYQKFRDKFIAKTNKYDRKESEYSSVFTKNEVEVKLECDYDYENLDAYSGEDNNKWDRSDGDDSDDGDPVFKPRIKKEITAGAVRGPRKTKTKAKDQGPRKTKSKRSFVWQHFSFTTEDDGPSKQCQCHHCGKILSSDGTTTSLRFHLFKHHSDIIDQKPQDMNSKQAIAGPPKGNTKRAKGSFVWDHYIKDRESGSCECLHCGKSLSSVGGNTTSLRKHMMTSHPEKIESTENMEARRGEILASEEPDEPIVDPETGEMLTKQEYKKKMRKKNAVTKERKSSVVWKYFHRDPDDPKKCICQICFKVILYLGAGYSSMLGHLRSHNVPEVEKEEKIMEESPCSVCGKLLPSKAALKTHETLHRNQDKYVCSYCPKAFCTKTRKTIHERVHTGEKPYQCNECGNRFRQKQQLVAHSRVHTGETAYQCPRCLQRFKFLASRNNHKCAAVTSY